ncbi:MAG: B12-binding domain-containing radical SAM protein [Pelagibacteraceae bacterium]|nr:B12-binding domain-containing radical SAM protein [Pelagibacteraceae bacterium]
MLRQIKDPKFLLVYPPLQFQDGEVVRPDGCLANAYLDASLTKAGFESKIIDMAVGDEQDTLEETFYNPVKIKDAVRGVGSISRIGMSTNRILESVKDYDIIGITSVFTQQASMCFEVSNLIKKHYPEKIVIGGGSNCRAMSDLFLNNGFDVIFTSEAEFSIVEFARSIHKGDLSLSKVEGICFHNGIKYQRNPVINTIWDLDEIPMPSWHKLPLKKHWDISNLWTGREGFVEFEDEYVKYANIFTSRGCPFNCTFCHISGENDDWSGDIGKFRVHSVDRVVEEFKVLKDLGVKYLYINDDSLLAKKKRAYEIFDKLRSFDFRLADINGINIVHFFKKHKGKLIVDEELLHMFYEAGFRKLSIPLENGNQRILDKWCDAKWNIERCDTISLVKKMKDIGIATDGNIMMGFPDETPDELTQSFIFAKRHMEAGMDGLGFFIVQPLPGTKLYHQTIANGQLSPDWHPDEIGWVKGSMFENMLIPNEVLIYCRRMMWQVLGLDEKKKSVVDFVQSHYAYTDSMGQFHEKH